MLALVCIVCDTVPGPAVLHHESPSSTLYTRSNIIERALCTPTTSTLLTTIMANGPKRSESDVYDRQIRLWGAEAQVSSHERSFTEEPEQS